MPMSLCVAGKHMYDAEAHAECPYCLEDREALEEDGKGTGTGAVEASQKEKKASSGLKTLGLDAVLPEKKHPDPSPVPPRSTLLVAGGNQRDAGGKAAVETPVAPIPDGRKPLAPVAGWLVLLNGRFRGLDFRLVEGVNRIGRGRDMEVCLDFGEDSDTSVSRETHAQVVYEGSSGTFSVERGSSRNLPLLNGKTLRRDAELNEGDVLMLGTTRLRFVPFRA